MSNLREAEGRGYEQPGRDGRDVTPKSTEFTDGPCKSLWIGTGGHVQIITEGGTTLTFKNVPSGSPLPMRCTHVLADGTTAEDIIAIY